MVRAGLVRADEIALHRIVIRGGAANGDAVLLVVSNHVGGREGQAADGIRRRVKDGDAVAVAGRCVGAGDVGAYEVALNQIEAGAATTNDHASTAVAGDDVAGTGIRAANNIPRSIRDNNAVA